jgi:hypothetical protein
MATSGYTDVTVTNWDTLRFSWEVESQSIAANTTTVSWKMQLIAGGSGRISATSQSPWTIKVNGKTYTGAENIGISNNATKTLASGSTVISHNSDGSKTFSYEFSQTFNITFSGNYISTKSGSGSGTLPTISRTSTPTVSANSVDMGAKVTIYTNRDSTALTHELAYSFMGGGYVTFATGVGDSYSWTTPDLASQIPNATSGSLTLRCITKSGNTSVGTKTLTMTLKVPSTVVPSISNVATAEATAGIAAQFGAFVKLKSRIKATITAAGAKGSTIKTYSSTFNGKSYSGASWTSAAISTSGTLNLVVKVTDSRGRTASKTVTVTVLDYDTPAIYALQAYRINADGTENREGVHIAVRYKYGVTSLGGKNTASMVLEYKRSTETEWATLLTGTGLSADLTRQITDISFSIDYQYDLRMVVNDWFGPGQPYTATLGSGAVIFDIRGDGLGLAFFKTSERDGVEFGASAKGAVLGLWEATAEIPENGDFNNYLQPGVYAVAGNAVMETLSNRPCERAGTLRVSSGLGVKKIAGAYAYLIQEFHPYHNQDPVYRRHMISDAAGAFSPGPWRAITFRGQKILWEGGRYMTAGHTAELSEPVSQQDNGIVLVFSTYQNGAAIDANFNHFFVPKKFVEIMGGFGSAFQMNTVNFNTIGTKYLYIHDDYISGNENNDLSGTATSGITFNNAMYVLRYVLGV